MICRINRFAGLKNAMIQRFHFQYSTLNFQFLRLLPFVMVLSTVFVVRPELGNGVVSGKYFWFYLSMGAIAGESVLRRFKRSTTQGLPGLRIDPADCLILFYGVYALGTSYFVHSSEAVTKHILLLLVIVLYFYFKRFLSISGRHRYLPVLFFIATGTVEAIWGLRQLYGFEYSQHALFKLTGSFFNPGPYACYLAVVVPAAFWYLLRDRHCTQVRFRLRYWAIYTRWATALLTCTGALLVLPAAMSRASWLAALGGCAFVVLTGFKKRNRAGHSCVFLPAKYLSGSY